MRISDWSSDVCSSDLGFIKALIDGCLIVATVPITIPLVLFTALCIKLESPGPALFVQERMGRGNKPFKMYKLRSMRNGTDDSPQFAGEDDPRITRVGRIIRKDRTSVV